MNVLPYYMAIGMPYELFWHDDPILAKSYRDAHELHTQMKNQEMWMQGIYCYQAFRTVAEGLVYSFNGAKGQKPKEYPSEPFPITAAEQKAHEERNKQRTLAWVQDGQR